ncbi:MAG: Ni/Fe-hydrogenase, b-type cytochrome subunit [Burkholderiaceae bacterium]
MNAMSTQAGSRLFPVYVWEAPVRIWHWVMSLCILVLAVTGYLIGTPLESVGGEASDHFLFGYIRFTHFAAAYVFAVMFLLRVVWAFMGNRFAREMFLVPLELFDARWWDGFLDQTRHYLFLKPEARPWQGHNPLAAAAMFFMYVLGTVFMICTGFAMYGEAQGMESLTFKAFTSWVMPLLGFSQNVHTLHHLGMWYLIVFTLMHLYFVIREDALSGQTIISTMISGWRMSKR